MLTNEQAERELEDFAIECAADPVRWSRFAWNWGKGDLAGVDGVREWQLEVMEAIGVHLRNPKTRFTPLKIAIASGHGIGKSAEIAMICNWAMSTAVGTRIVVTANTENQLRTKTSPELGKWFRSAINSHWFEINALSIKAKDAGEKDNWKLDLLNWSEENSEAFAGLHNKGKRILIIFDEASGIPPKIWEVVEGAMTDADTEIIFLAFGNPTQNTGRFKDCFDRDRKYWKTKQIDSRTVEGTNLLFFEELKEKYGEDSDIFKVRVRGQFPSQSVKQFISQDLILQSMNRQVSELQYSFAPAIIGVDYAWEGDDEIVIFLRKGIYSEILEVIPKNNNDNLIAQKIVHYEKVYNVQAVFVDLGGGGNGLLSAGLNLGRQWIGVWFSHGSSDAQYLNKRAEMIGNIRDWLKQGGVLPKDDGLMYELMSFETIPHTAGKIQFEAKKDMKKRGLPSPNKADALGLTFAYPVTNAARFDEDDGGVRTHFFSRRDNGAVGEQNPVYGGWRR